MSDMKIYTIGFTKKTAEEFFTRIIQAGVRRVIDIRLNNVSQLAGYTKRDDLRYFLRAIGGIDYVHRLDLAPTKELLDIARKSKDNWAAYERDFLALLAARKVEESLPRASRRRLSPLQRRETGPLPPPTRGVLSPRKVGWRRYCPSITIPIRRRAEDYVQPREERKVSGASFSLALALSRHMQTTKARLIHFHR